MTSPFPVASIGFYIQSAGYYLGVGLVFLIMISILVFAHEMGHYLTARMFGMGVEEFAIGFGKRPLFVYLRKQYTVPLKDGEVPSQPRVLSEDWKDSASAEPVYFPGDDEPVVMQSEEGAVLHETTKFTVRPWPLGGFVRIKGMVPEDDGSEIRVAGGFYSKAPWQRFIVLLAGPFFSVLTGIAMLTPVFMIDGISKPDPRPILDMVSPKLPADVAGLKEGDRITAIDGKPIDKFYQLVVAVRDHPGVPLKIDYIRGKQTRKTVVTPVRDPESDPIVNSDLDPTPDSRVGQGKIGVRWGEVKVMPNVGGALIEAVQTPIDTVRGIVSLFARPARFENTVNGPVGMVKITSIVVQEGILRVVWLMAMLSISVGIFNLFPVPPLDGGQMAIAIAEMFRGGRRLSIQVQSMISGAGFILVILLFGSAMYVDLKHLAPRRDPLSLMPPKADEHATHSPGPGIKPVPHAMP